MRDESSSDALGERLRHNICLFITCVEVPRFVLGRMRKSSKICQMVGNLLDKVYAFSYLSILLFSNSFTDIKTKGGLNQDNIH